MRNRPAVSRRLTWQAAWYQLVKMDCYFKMGQFNPVLAGLWTGENNGLWNVFNLFSFSFSLAAMVYCGLKTFLGTITFILPSWRKRWTIETQIKTLISNLERNSQHPAVFNNLHSALFPCLKLASEDYLGDIGNLIGTKAAWNSQNVKLYNSIITDKSFTFLSHYDQEPRCTLRWFYSIDQDHIVKVEEVFSFSLIKILKVRQTGDPFRMNPASHPKR